MYPTSGVHGMPPNYAWGRPGQKTNTMRIETLFYCYRIWWQILESLSEFTFCLLLYQGRVVLSFFLVLSTSPRLNCHLASLNGSCISHIPLHSGLLHAGWLLELWKWEKMSLVIHHFLWKDGWMCALIIFFYTMLQRFFLWFNERQFVAYRKNKKYCSYHKSNVSE